MSIMQPSNWNELPGANPGLNQQNVLAPNQPNQAQQQQPAFAGQSPAVNTLPGPVGSFGGSSGVGASGFMPSNPSFYGL